jgi:hypothetical protein
MTQRKIKVCAYVRGSSPHAKSIHQHDWRPRFCREQRCLGFLEECEHSEVRTITERNEIRKMIAYLQKLKKHTEGDNL